MHDAITDSTKHCRMAAPVADNALLLEPNCIYVCMFIFITYADVEGQSWDKFVINCFGVLYNLYLAIRGLYNPRLRLGWYSPLIARYKLYHTPKQLITNNIYSVYIPSGWRGQFFSTNIYHWKKKLSLKVVEFKLDAKSADLHLGFQITSIWPWTQGQGHSQSCHILH